MRWLELYQAILAWQQNRGYKKGAIAAIANDESINVQRVKVRTLETRFKQWVKDGQPGEVKPKRGGGHNRAFTIEE